MNCNNCGSKAEKGWKHCPHCGARLGPYSARGDIFSQLFKEMDEITKSMGMKMDRDMEVIDISDMLEDMMKSMDDAKENSGRRGFSLRMHQRNDEKPKIMFRRIGAQPTTSRLRGQPYGHARKGIIPMLRKPIDARQPTHKLGIKLPKETSEPETEVRRSGNKVLVDIRLPGVKNSGDIDISELENSVEIKAVAGSRGYFKIIRKPEFSKITKKSFGGGLLKLELL